MRMTIGELIEALEDIRDSSPTGSETEVRIAYQRNYPLAATVAGVTDSREFENSEDEQPVAWIATGEIGWDESPYASSEAWDGAYADC
jgi:hypothetical protein